jgi:hypothetical protein
VGVACKLTGKKGHDWLCLWCTSLYASSTLLPAAIDVGSSGCAAEGAAKMRYDELLSLQMSCKLSICSSAV